MSVNLTVRVTDEKKAQWQANAGPYMKLSAAVHKAMDAMFGAPATPPVDPRQLALPLKRIVVRGDDVKRAARVSAAKRKATPAPKSKRKGKARK